MNSFELQDSHPDTGKEQEQVTLYEGFFSDFQSFLNLSPSSTSEKIMETKESKHV